MSENLNGSGLCKLELCKLVGKQVLTTETLWKEIFSEDSKEFVDYYYQYKAPKNTALILTEQKEIISMVHLTPYEAVFMGAPNKKKAVSYIVGVATKEKYRHKGCMRKLLYESFLELYKRKEPFTFLMPADPEIYRPFSFTYIYEREEYVLNPNHLEPQVLKQLAMGNIKEPKKMTEKYSLQLATSSDAEKLAAFAKKALAKQYALYMNHTKQYYETLLQETKSQKGGIFLIKKQGKLLATATCALDGNAPFLQEILFADQEGEEAVEQLFLRKPEKKPIIMARIIHVEEMLALLNSQVEKEILLSIKDKDIPFNEGLFLWQVGNKYSQVRKLTNGDEENCEKTNSEKKMIPVSIQELTEQIFTGQCKNTRLESVWKEIQIYNNSLINEIV